MRVDGRFPLPDRTFSELAAQGLADASGARGI